MFQTPSSGVGMWAIPAAKQPERPNHRSSLPARLPIGPNLQWDRGKDVFYVYSFIDLKGEPRIH